MKRTVIKIDEARCIGCGACVSGCHGGALQLIDGKAKIVNEMFCDGLGACIGECPVDALTLEERETEPHKAESDKSELHGAMLFTSRPHNYNLHEAELHKSEPHNYNLHEADPNKEQPCCNVFTPLRQFPIQLRLLNPFASFLKNSDLVLAADCTAFVYSHFHHRYIKNNSIAIACPKLDHSAELYVEKLTAMIDNSEINTLTVIIMEVPCCSGLWHIAQQAQANAKRKIPIKKIIIGINGEIRNT